MKLRPEFWANSKKFIDWCTDDELSVLKQRTENALEQRLNNLIGKYDIGEKIAKSKKQKAVKRRITN